MRIGFQDVTPSAATFAGGAGEALESYFGVQDRQAQIEERKRAQAADIQRRAAALRMAEQEIDISLARHLENQRQFDLKRGDARRASAASVGAFEAMSRATGPMQGGSSQPRTGPPAPPGLGGEPPELGQIHSAISEWVATGGGTPEEGAEAERMVGALYLKQANQRLADNLMETVLGDAQLWNAASATGAEQVDVTGDGEPDPFEAIPNQVQKMLATPGADPRAVKAWYEGVKRKVEDAIFTKQARETNVVQWQAKYAQQAATNTDPMKAAAANRALAAYARGEYDREFGDPKRAAEMAEMDYAQGWLGKQRTVDDGPSGTGVVSYVDPNDAEIVEAKKREGAARDDFTRSLFNAMQEARLRAGDSPDPSSFGYTPEKRAEWERKRDAEFAKIFGLLSGATDPRELGDAPDRFVPKDAGRPTSPKGPMSAGDAISKRSANDQQTITMRSDGDQQAATWDALSPAQQDELKASILKRQIPPGFDVESIPPEVMAELEAALKPKKKAESKRRTAPAPTGGPLSPKGRQPAL